jgi:hypothetical protein
MLVLYLEIKFYKVIYYIMVNLGLVVPDKSIPKTSDLDFRLGEEATRLVEGIEAAVRELEDVTTRLGVKLAKIKQA